MASLLSQKRTLVIGLNPALQRTVTLSASLQVGSVNRGSSVQVGIGGKGQDVIVASISMNANPPPVLVQFLGKGAEGDALAGLIETLLETSSAATAAGISEFSKTLSVRTSAPCRTCVTLVDRVKGEATEIVEPSGTVSETELINLVSTLDLQFKESKPMGVAVMGSMPPGCPVNMYASILERVCNINTKVVFDTATGIFESLAACGALNSDAIIKLNARELCKLADVNIEAEVTGGEASSAVPLHFIEQACARIAPKISHLADHAVAGRVYVAVTDGPYTSTLIRLKPAYTSGNGVRFTVPRLPRPMMNPIGAGDAVASGTLLRWCDMVSVPDLQANSNWSDLESAKGQKEFEEVAKAFAWGLACGAASCMGDANSVFDISDANDLYSGIKPVRF